MLISRPWMTALITSVAQIPLVAAAQGTTVGAWENFKNNSSFAVYARGVEDGYGTANIQLQFEKREPLYCPPQRLSINPENIRDMVDAEMKLFDFPPGAPISYVMLRGLQRTFPCP